MEENSKKIIRTVELYSYVGKTDFFSLLNDVFENREFYDCFKKENVDIKIIVGENSYRVLSKFLIFEKKSIENDENVFKNNIKRLIKVLLDNGFLFDIYKFALNNLEIFKKISLLGESVYNYRNNFLDYKSNEVYIYDFRYTDSNSKIPTLGFFGNRYYFRKITEKDDIFRFLELFYDALKKEIEGFETVSDFFDI